MPRTKRKAKAPKRPRETTPAPALVRANPTAAKLIGFAHEFSVQRRSSMHHAMNERVGRVRLIERRLLAAIAQGKPATLTADEELFLTNPVRGL